MTTRSRILTVLGTVSAAQLLVVSSANAQQTTAVLNGRVIDAKTGQGLADVAVVVTATSLQGEQSVVTDSSGFYRIPNLPSGNYNVQMFRGSYKPFERTGVRLAAGQSIRLNGTMLPEGSDAIEVVVEAPSIDTGSSSTGVSLGQEFLTRVPVIAPQGNGGAVRSFEAIAAAAPGTRGDTYGQSLGGASSPENTYLVNGLNTANTALGTNGSPLSIEFMEEVQVLTGAYLPEYGMNTGGTISGSLKRGSNEFHGHAWASFAPGALVGNVRELESVTSTIGTTNKLKWLGDIGADVGGPIIKDKLWFYAGVMVGHTEFNLTRSLREFTIKEDEVEVTNPDGTVTKEKRYSYERLADGSFKAKDIAGSEETFRAQGTAIQAVARLSYAINKDQQLDFFFTALPTTGGGNDTFFANATDGNANSALNGSVDTLAVKTNRVPIDASLKWLVDADNKRWNFEQMVAVHRETVSRFANDGSRRGEDGLGSVPAVLWRKQDPTYHGLSYFEDNVPGVCKKDVDGLSPCPVTSYITGGPGRMDDQKQTSFQVRQTTTRILELAGHHEIKFGGNYSLNIFDQDKGNTGGVFFREHNRRPWFQLYRGFGYLQGPSDPVYLDSLHFTSKLHAGRVFLQDSWSVMDKITLNLGVLYDSQSVIGGLGDTTLLLNKQFSPRLGFVWDPTGKGRAKIRGNWGRYFQSISLQLADRSGTPEPGLAAYWDESSCAGGPDGVKELKDASKCRDPGGLMPLFGAPSGRVFGFSGVKVPIDRNLKAPAKDELSLGADWEFIPKYSAGVDFTWSYIVRAMEDMSRDDGNTYFIGNPGFGIATDFPKATRDYKALTFRLAKNFSDHWMMQANHTLTWMNGNYGGLFRAETGQLDPNITSEFDLQSLLKNRSGPMDGDIRHNFKLFAGGDVPLGEKWRIELGGAFTATQGTWINLLGAHPLYGDNESVLTPRASWNERTPWVFNINANAGIGFQLSNASRVTFGVSAFNLFNFQQTTSVDQTYTRDSDIAPQDNYKDLLNAVNELWISNREAAIEEAKAEGNMELADELQKAFDEQKDVKKESGVDKGLIERADIDLLNQNRLKPNRFQPPRQVQFTLKVTF